MRFDNLANNVFDIQVQSGHYCWSFIVPPPMQRNTNIKMENIASFANCQRQFCFDVNYVRLWGTAGGNCILFKIILRVFLNWNWNHPLYPKKYVRWCFSHYVSLSNYGPVDGGTSPLGLDIFPRIRQDKIFNVKFDIRAEGWIFDKSIKRS